MYGSSTSVTVKMQWKCLLVLCCLTVVVNSASISKKSIPVKIVYDSQYAHKNYIRNLNEKLQLSAEELKHIESRSKDVLNVHDEQISSNVLENAEDAQQNGLAKNLEEKVQLSSEELKQIPLGDVSSTKNIYRSALRNHNEKVQLSSTELGEALKHLPVIDENTDEDFSSLRYAALEDPDKKGIYEQVKDIVNDGIQNLKNSAEASEFTKLITSDVWEKLDTEAEKFLEEIKAKYSLRQSNQGLLDQFQQFTNNFLSQFTGSNPANVSNDEGQPGFPQNVVNFFTGGLQQIQSGLSNLAGAPQQSPVQNDPDVTTKAPSNSNNNNPIQGLVSSFQGVFGQFNPFNQGQKPGTEGEETTQPSGPIQSIQSAFNQFGETINNLNPFNPSTQKPGTASDETTTTPAGPIQVIQGIASQAGQVFNQFNPFQPSTTKPPSADPTKNPIQSAAENIGSQITEGISNFTSGNNPLSGVAQQVGEAVQGGNNPLSGAVQQVSQAVSGGNNPLSGITGGNNPLEAAQGVASQIGEAVSGNNPLQSGSNPLEALQAVAGQIGGGLTGNSPSKSEDNPSQVSQNDSNEGGKTEKEATVVKEETKVDDEKSKEMEKAEK